MSRLGEWWRGRRSGEAEALPLYNAVVERARQPHWYMDGAVPDTVDGRFDMIAAALSAVLLRLEAEPAAAQLSVWLTERFITDMDGQLRELGIGDVVVGKHVGRMMGMLGGRLGAYRNGLAAGDLRPALARNLYRGAAPEGAAVEHVVAELTALSAALAETPLDALQAGRLP